MDASNRTDRAKMTGPKTLASLASTTVAFALSRGLTPVQIEEATGLQGLDFVDPDARLPDDVLAKLWLAIEANEDPMAVPSLEMAKAAPFSMFGGLAHGVQFAVNLREALTLMIRNRIVVADRLELSLHEHGDEAALVNFHPMDQLDNGRANEAGVAVATRVLSEILQVSKSLIRVEFSHPPRGSLEAYQSFFRVPVLFERERNALILQRAFLEAPISRANVQLFAYVEQHFDQVRSRIERARYPSELEKLRNVIIENGASGNYEPASAAARANLSLRSAQRLVSAHGTSLQTLIDDIRVAHAKEFLSDPAIRIETVALLVGYSDDRAFRRAFKRWTGQTPSTYRSRSMAPPD